MKIFKETGAYYKSEHIKPLAGIKTTALYKVGNKNPNIVLKPKPSHTFKDLHNAVGELMFRPPHGELFLQLPSCREELNINNMEPLL